MTAAAMAPVSTTGGKVACGEATGGCGSGSTAFEGTFAATVGSEGAVAEGAVAATIGGETVGGGVSGGGSVAVTAVSTAAGVIVLAAGRSGGTGLRSCA
jgi:hypothetical protein